MCDGRERYIFGIEKEREKEGERDRERERESDRESTVTYVAITNFILDKW